MAYRLKVTAGEESDKVIRKVLEKLKPKEPFRETCENAIFRWLMRMMERDVPTSELQIVSPDVRDALAKIDTQLHRLNILVAPFAVGSTGFGKFWAAGLLLDLPQPNHIEEWRKTIAPYLPEPKDPAGPKKKPAAKTKAAARKAAPDPLAKTAAMLLLDLAPFSTRKFTKRELSKIGGELLGDASASGAIHNYLKGNG